jgi:outer membrane receptor protein involved in Fe transport
MYNLKTLLLSISIIIIGFKSAIAQTTLKGNVVDTKTNEKLIGVSVLVKGSTKGSQTDYDGQFVLKTTTELPLVLVLKYLGYETKEINVTDVKAKINVKLSKSEKALKEVNVRDSRITEKIKQNPLTVETMDAIAIKTTPAANFYEGLAHLKGVDITSASIGFKIINTRGFNSTSPVRSLQLIDGVDNQSPGLNFSLGNFLGASELDIQKVDLVVGASSAYYGPNAFNGVINMQTKSPFLYPGLSAQIKVGERSLTETAIRWAQIIKNKDGIEKFAYKMNVFYMQANDWNATNLDATSQSPVGRNNAGSYDAVNRYGDEFTSNIFYTPLSLASSVGKGYYLRNGYDEKDLVDYNSKNLKLSGAAHYKVTKNTELIYATSFGTGTTVYQGENRFSLRDILFFQNKLELKKDNRFFIRAYATNEDAGNSYDAYNTALLLQKAAKSDENWGKDYNNSLTANLSPKVNQWIQNNWTSGLNLSDTNNYKRTELLSFIDNYWKNNFNDTLNKYHGLARDIANAGGVGNVNGIDRFVPGTARFDSAFKAITSRTNQNGGSRFFDQSALYHVAAELKFNTDELSKKNASKTNIDITLGGNYRIYVPYSQGTIFKDGEEIQKIFVKDSLGNTLKRTQTGFVGDDSISGFQNVGFIQITNQEFGAYIGFERKFIENKLKVSVTNRVDKNQNFNFLWSPAATLVYTQKKNVFRFSLSSAVRNPTLTDQYFNLNVGRATLLGNLSGYKGLITIDTLRDILVNNNRYRNGEDRLKTSSFDIEAIRPERCKTVEFGYRGNITEKLFVDASYYYSWYEDFLGFKIGAQVVWDSVSLFPTSVNAFRVTTNSKDIVTTQGFTIGLNYFYKNYLGFSGNYSWNKLDRGGSRDPIIPAFNTPEHKFNLGVNGRDISYLKKKEKWGYGVNFKWQEGFLFEGSPQFTGVVPSYGMLDVQWNSTISKLNAVFKLGASNILNNTVYQVYGGPYVGRMAYASITFELNKWK